MMTIDPAVETVTRCVLCPDVAAAPDERFARCLGLRPPYAVRHCPSCGLRWLSPRPTAAGYAQLYTAEHYFDGATAPEDFAQLARQRAPYFAARIRRIERVLGNTMPLHMLDVGAATGEFVHEAQQRGHLADGIELSADARARARDRYGIELRGVTLEQIDTPARYDVVHMNHVFEHLPDPCAALDVCRRLLKPGGLLVLEVPRQIDNDLDRLRRFLMPWRHARFDAYSLHHTYFFTSDTLGQLVMRRGFGIVSIATANRHRTPLWPPAVKNWILRVYLGLADWVHRGGNIIELYARR